MTIDTPEWVQDAVFYQVFPDRFARSARMVPVGPYEAWDAPPTNHGFKGGDLYGIAERLGELHELGITALYLTPVFASASNHRYHAYDYFTVDPMLGGDEALRELLDAAHARGMRVILDGVFNHSGRGFWPFHHVVENGAQSPYRDWFHLDPEVAAGHRGLEPYPDRGGRDASRIGYAAWWGIPDLPKINVGHPAAREYLLSVAEHWLRFGIDGWRLDVPAEIDDEAFWQEFRRRCRAVRPDAYLVGEIWHEAPEWLRGDRFDALMNYPLTGAIIGFVGGDAIDFEVVGRHDSYRDLIKVRDGAAFGDRVAHLMSNYDPAIVRSQLNLIGSHDTPRALTVMGGDVRRLRLATLLQATLPGAPSIYYGDEIAMAGDHDPDCRRAYPEGPEPGDRETRACVAALLAARREHVALRRGTVRAIGAAGRVAAFGRTAEGRHALVAVNAGDEAATVVIGRSPSAMRILSFPGIPSGTIEQVNEHQLVRLPPLGAVVAVD